MKTLVKCIFTFFIISVFTLTIISVNVCASIDSKNETLDQTSAFLSNVVQLDMTKYKLASSNSPIANNLSDVTKETANYQFETDEGMIDVLSIFVNGQLAFVRINSEGNNAHIYSSAPAKNVIDQSNMLLTKYAEFKSQKFSDVSFITAMKNILGEINSESSTNITAGNINFQLSKNENDTILQWIYVDYGTIMNWKRVELVFRNVICCLL